MNLRTLPKMQRAALQAYRFLWHALDWVYPPECGGCGSAGERWCAGCQIKVKRVGANTCPRCGEPQASQVECPACLAHPPAFEQARAFGYFNGPLRHAIHKLKYRSDIGLGEALAGYLVEKLAECNWPVDVVSPVPLSHQRYIERGYNQAAMLAHPLALSFGYSYLPGAVARTRETRSQVGLTEIQRAENMKNAFIGSERLVRGHTVLLVDDVMTTGATLHSCASALMDAGASAVYGLTLAKTVHLDDSHTP